MSGIGNTSSNISSETRQLYQALINTTLPQYIERQKPVSVRATTQATPKKLRKREIQQQYEKSPKGKAARKRVLDKKNKARQNQPIISVSDKIILCTGKAYRKVDKHPANIQYNKMVNTAYTQYEAADNKDDKISIINGLITQIAGIGLQFIVIANPEAREGRELLKCEQYSKILVHFNKIREKQNKILHNQSDVPTYTDIDDGGGKMSPSELAAMKRKRSDSETS